MGGGTEGVVLVHVGTNNSEKERTTTFFGRFKMLVKTLKEARIGHIVLSGILPIMGGRDEEHRNCSGWRSTLKYRRYEWWRE